MEGEAAPVGVSDTNFDNLFAELNVPDTLPEAAMRRAQRHVEESTPKLLELLRGAVAMAKRGEMPDWQPVAIAMMLLWEFKAKELLPPLVELLSLPGELTYDLLGDSISEQVPQILALFAHDRIELIEGLITNRELNESIRWAAISSLSFLIRDGRVSREDTIERLRGHLRDAIEQRDFLHGTALVHTLAELGAKEAESEVREAFRWQLVDEVLITEEEVEDLLTAENETFRDTLDRLGPTELDDSVELLRTWYCFQPQSEREKSSTSFSSLSAWPPSPALAEEFTDDALEDEPITTSRQVGRNDPCPCGSGKKFKKCCGSRKNNPDL
jgi:hypothetical protein